MFGVALTIYILQWQEVNLPYIIRNHLNNLLCMPVVLTTCLALLQLIKKNYHLTMPIFVITSVTLYYILFFEWYLPKVNPRYTADLIDVLLYISGTVIFYIMQNKWVAEEK